MAPKENQKRVSQSCLQFLDRQLRAKGAEVSSSVNSSLIFENAIAEHIEVIQALRSQREVLERIACEMTRAIVGETRCSGAAMVEARPTRSIWQPN